MTFLLHRRDFLRLSAAGLAVNFVRGSDFSPLPGFIGINTSSFAYTNRSSDPAQRIDPYDVPQVMSEELGLHIIDLVSTMLNTRETAALEKFRAKAEKVGSVITNLKVNVPKLRFDSEDASTRRHALDEYKLWIDAAAVLGARWIRPIPGPVAPRWETLVAGYSELADYAAARNVTVLVENYLWLENKPEAIPQLVKALSGRIAGQPDTLNWVDNPTRLKGLAAAFPVARSCDFKVGKMGSHFEYSDYDLRAAFDLGRTAGFRGPWCIEHPVAEKATLLRELKWLTGKLREWDAAFRGP